jgi:hypothetical protein
MKTMKIGAAALLMVGSAFALAGCADGYRDDGYSRVSVGVSSSSGGMSHRRGRDSDHDGVPNRYDRDRDGDGTPNAFDSRPNNPYRD